MKNPFKRAGFDSLIAKGTSIHGDLVLAEGSTTIIDGVLIGRYIKSVESSAPTTLVIGGEVTVSEDVKTSDVTITGHLTCCTLHVEGTLAIKLGSKVHANKVRYRRLIIEPGATLNAQLIHLDGPQEETK